MSNNAFSLVVKIAGQDPVKHNLEADTITCGRGPDNGIQVLVAEVSVAHGELVKAGETYKFVDKGSSNGTKVNGQPVDSEGTALAPMDKILLGATTPAYFVPASVADSGSLEELIAGIEAAPKSAAPSAAAAAPAKPAPVKPAAVQPAAVPAAAVAGASTVKLAQVQAPKPGAPAPLRPPGAAPAAPSAPSAPGAGGAPPSPAPLAPKPGSPAAPPAPAPAKPAGGVAPTPVPLKKVEPKAPSIPLPPKKPSAE